MNYRRLTASLFWVWILVLVAVNVIPIGNDANNSLSGSKIFEFRLDYLVHLIMILFFAWIWVLGKINNVKWFPRYEAAIFSSLVIVACVVLELLQVLIPWRSFNPVDMLYNLLGGQIVVGIVHLSRNCKESQPT